MNFFEYQDKARRNTTLLVTLFAAAVLALIAITTLFFAFIGRASGAPGTENSVAGMLDAMGWDTVAGIAITITAVIALASFYRLRQLAAGGRAVAESLGGRKINIAPRDLAEQRALNVVEEMALASGTPVPDVYVLDDDAINAFAAGYQPSDAVIGLTRGCIEQLNRDELQGVVAHEFSHIFNGDMRLNIRIVGLLHGILIIGLVGTWLLRGSYWGTGRDSRGRAALLGVGAGLVAIGYTGTFFGNLIKSAVSRQREYLADASAVQFTRSNSGIAGALKKIGSHLNGSSLRAANASEFSHMYFASSLKQTFLGLFATHPPLSARIGRLDPGWKGWGGQTPTPAATAHSEQISGIHSAEIQPTTTADQFGYRTHLERVIEAVDNNVAQPSAAQLQLGCALLARIPPNLKAAAREPFAARAVVYALMMDPGQFALQRAVLEKSAHPAVLREFDRLQPAIAELPATCRLPLLDLCVPALKSLAPQQYQIFKRNLIKLLRADGKVEIWEWALYRVLMHGLEANPDQQRKAASGSGVGNAQADAQRFLLAAVAHTGNAEYLNAKRAFEVGLATLGQTPVPLPAARDMSLQRLDKAIAIARDTAPLKKPALLKALATTLAHDGLIRAREVELLRAIADCLDCPMPPLVSNPELPLRHEESSIAVVTSP